MVTIGRGWILLVVALAGCVGLQDFGDRDGDAGGPGDGGAGDGAPAEGGTGLDGGGDGGDGGGVGGDGGKVDGGAGDGGTDAADGASGAPPGTILVPTAGDVQVTWEDDALTVALTHLTHDTYVDANEVTVGQFRAWLTASSPIPCPGKKCSLDPGGPYATAMLWDPADEADVASTAYRDSSICGSSSNLSNDPGDAPTFPVGKDDLPVNCVTYGQAVGVCAFRGMRLMTEVEWFWTASGRGQKRKYASGDTTPSACADAMLSISGNNDNDCGFPLPVTAVTKDVSRDLVRNMMGSLQEWMWGAYRISKYPTTLPTDYVGPPREFDAPVRGGHFAQRPSDVENRLVTSGNPSQPLTAVGFRCAKTKL